MNHIEILGRDWIRLNATSLLAPTHKPGISFVTTSLVTNTIGARVDHLPFTGVAVHADQVMSIVLDDQGDFIVIDNTVLPQSLQVTSRVTVTPYARRHFNGARVDGMFDPLEHADGNVHKLPVKLVGSMASKIPVAEPKSDEGKHMLDFIHRARCPDGVRVLSNLLVDIGASNLAFLEGVDKMALVFDCNTSSFNGRIQLSMTYTMQDFCLEMFTVLTSGDEKLQHKHESVSPDDLPTVMSVLLCDGSWKKAHVQVHSSATTAASAGG